MSPEAEAILGLSIALALGLVLLGQRSVRAWQLARRSDRDALLADTGRLVAAEPDPVTLATTMCATLVTRIRPLVFAALLDPTELLEHALLACAPEDHAPLDQSEYELARRAADTGASATLPVSPQAGSRGMVLAVPCQKLRHRVLLVRSRAAISETDRLLVERVAADLALGLHLAEGRSLDQRLAGALARVGDAVVTTDGTGTVDWVNEAFVTTFADSADAIGRPLRDLLTGLGADLPHVDARDASLRTHLRTRQGVTASVQITISLLEAGSTEPGVVAVLHDLRPEEATADVRTQLTHILEEASDGITIVDHRGTILFLNAGGRRLLAVPRETTVEGRHFLELIPHEIDRSHLADLHRKALQAGVVRTEVELSIGDAAPQPLSLVLLAHRGADGQILYVSAIARDIRDQRAREQELSYLAQHDPLTNLPNRRLFEPLVQAGIARAERSGLGLALGVIDLDDFKPVNDSLGHPAGDRLLTELARRLASMTRESDHLVRLGGDEFALILTDLSPGDPASELLPALARLHRAVETPFEIATGLHVSIDMTMGVALYPRDGTTPDALLREADAALYAAKKGRPSRQRWWRYANEPTLPASERRVGPYGSTAATKLARLAAREQLAASVASQLDEEFRAGTLGAHLTLLTPEEADALTARIAAHIALLLDPALDHDTLLGAARGVGCVHALTGLSAQDVVEGAHLLEAILTRAINDAPGSLRDRRAAAEIVAQRTKDDATAELEGMEQLRRQYLDVFTRPSPPPEMPWSDVISEELEAIGALPGTRSVCLARPDRHGSFVIEVNAGPLGERVAELLNRPDLQINVDPEHPRGKGHGAVAWREARIGTAAALHLDPSHSPWRWAIMEGGIRSLLAIPIQNFIGQPIALLLIYGQHPGQYESDWMAQFARNLQQRFESLFARYQAPALVTSREAALTYRKLLLTGGLRMYVQPIVDLRTGELRMVEGLARLADGHALIEPGAFLGILGLTELDQLFRLGLEQLGTLYHEWEPQGITPELSLNVQTSTLSHPKVVDWIGDTLATFQVPPEKLVLEILESDPTHLPLRSGTLAALLDLGIKLAIDDMGSGYSNWLRVVDLPAHYIKVDHTFVQRALYMPQKTIALIGTLMLAATEANQTIVLEGLEDPALVDMATHIGAELGQGFAIARPMPVAALARWVRSYHPVPGDRIRTMLGAMAYHWSSSHSLNGSRRAPAADCPLGRFFIDQGLADSEGSRLHAALHDGAGPEVVTALTEWFAAELEPPREASLVGPPPRSRGGHR